MEKTLTRLASGFLFFLSKAEFYSHLASLRLVICTPAYAVQMFHCVFCDFQVTLATFATFILSSEENHLDPQKAFVSLSLFNILRFPINLLPMIISYLAQVKGFSSGTWLLVIQAVLSVGFLRVLQLSSTPEYSEN
jgi:hypothetical protein